MRDEASLYGLKERKAGLLILLLWSCAIPVKKSAMLYSPVRSAMPISLRSIFMEFAGGYMVQAAVSAKYAFDLQPGDVYWCTADCGMV